MTDHINNRLDYLSKRKELENKIYELDSEDKYDRFKFRDGVVSYFKSKLSEGIYLNDIHKHIDSIDGISIHTNLGSGRIYTDQDQLKESLTKSIQEKRAVDVNYSSSYKFYYFQDDTNKHLYHQQPYITKYNDVRIYDDAYDGNIRIAILSYIGTKKYNPGDYESSTIVTVNKKQLNDYLDKLQ